MLTLKNIKMSKEQEVKADDLIEIIGSGQSKFLKEGVRKTVHRIAGENLIKSGAAFASDAEAVIPQKKGKKKADEKLKM